MTSRLTKSEVRALSCLRTWKERRVIDRSLYSAEVLQAARSLNRRGFISEGQMIQIELLQLNRPRQIGGIQP